MEVPTIYKAYVSEYHHKIWPYMVQYLHFRILKFPLTKTSVSGDSNGSLGSHPRFDSWLEKYAPDGPYMKEMTELEKEIVQTYPSYDAEAAIKQHAEFAAGWWLFNIGCMSGC